MSSKPLQFCFQGYTFDTTRKEVRFLYVVEFDDRDPLHFCEMITLPKKAPVADDDFLRRFLEPLSLILGISYYKIYCPPKISLPFQLSRQQADFWNTVYQKGLGEFLFRNAFDPSKIAKFPFSKTKMHITPVSVKVKDRILLGIGGGKDSIVAGELLKDFDAHSFLVETQRTDILSRGIAKKRKKPLIVIRRTLDPKLFEEHKGGYNGHIPVSAVFAFLGVFSAALYGYRYVTMANERSSNVGNIRYRGMEVNHQWSKSSEFESILQTYLRKYVTPDIGYFSLLRQFSEMRVAQMFSRQTEYFSLFSSCNKNFRVFKDRPKSMWCGECPKCVFVFLMLAPFLSKKDLIGIFPKNLFSEKSLLPLFRDILGFGKMKPFDCVGSFEESRAALFLAAKKFPNSLAVRTFLPKISNGEALARLAMQTSPAPTLPVPFRFLGIRNVCILGYGKEGKVTRRYIKKNYPHLRISILDKTMQDNYLDRQNDFDLALKTPGIPKRLVKIPYTTATNIFFAKNNCFTIGVTGSKGKSTTASLICTMLKADGREVRLLGNIGNPLLGALLSKMDPKTMCVIELSSYMLEDIEYSPNIAVLLNLFPDHMDYHGGVRQYYRAKRNIFAFQKEGDKAFKPPFHTERIPLEAKFLPLVGEHNKRNIQAAIRVVRFLGVGDKNIRKALLEFTPLPHRLEYVGTRDGILFYDDAISTTPESTIAGIQALRNVDTILLGGEDRGYDFRALEIVLRKYNVRNIVLFPESGKRILQSRDGFRVLETDSMANAVRFARQNTQKGKACLLSTASPSYSLWKNFEEKGNCFKRCTLGRKSKSSSCQH